MKDRRLRHRSTRWLQTVALFSLPWVGACDAAETPASSVDDAPAARAEPERAAPDEATPKVDAPELPEGFPLTLPPDVSRVVEIGTAAGRHVVVVESSASVETLAKLYVEQIEALGLETERAGGAKPSSTLVRSTERGQPNVAADLEPTDGGHTIVRLSAKRDFVAKRRVLAGDEELDPACVRFCEHEAECSGSKADCATSCAPGAAPAMPAVWACAEQSCEELAKCVTGALAAQ